MLIFLTIFRSRQGQGCLDSPVPAISRFLYIGGLDLVRNHLRA